MKRIVLAAAALGAAFLSGPVGPAHAAPALVGSEAPAGQSLVTSAHSARWHYVRRFYRPYPVYYRPYRVYRPFRHRRVYYRPYWHRPHYWHRPWGWRRHWGPRRHWGWRRHWHRRGWHRW